MDKNKIVEVYVIKGKNLAETSEELGINMTILRNFIVKNKLFKNVVPVKDDSEKKWYSITQMAD